MIVEQMLMDRVRLMLMAASIVPCHFHDGREASNKSQAIHLCKRRPLRKKTKVQGLRHAADEKNSCSGAGPLHLFRGQRSLSFAAAASAARKCTGGRLPNGWYGSCAAVDSTNRSSQDHTSTHQQCGFRTRIHQQNTKKPAESFLLASSASVSSSGSAEKTRRWWQFWKKRKRTIVRPLASEASSVLCRNDDDDAPTRQPHLARGKKKSHRLLQMAAVLLSVLVWRPVTALAGGGGFGGASSRGPVVPMER